MGNHDEKYSQQRVLCKPCEKFRKQNKVALQHLNVFNKFEHDRSMSITK